MYGPCTVWIDSALPFAKITVSWLRFRLTHTLPVFRVAYGCMALFLRCHLHSDVPGQHPVYPGKRDLPVSVV